MMERLILALEYGGSCRSLPEMDAIWCQPFMKQETNIYGASAKGAEKRQCCPHLFPC